MKTPKIVAEWITWLRARPTWQRYAAVAALAFALGLAASAPTSSRIAVHAECLDGTGLCKVYRTAGENPRVLICPSGWRRPTRSDFIAGKCPEMWQ